MQISNVNALQQQVQLTVLRRALDLASSQAEQVISQAEKAFPSDPDLGNLVDTRV